MGGEAGTGVIALHKVLGELGSFGLEKRQLQEDATASCPCLQGGHQEDEARFLKVEPGGRTGDHGCKTKRGSEQIIQDKEDGQALERVVSGAFQDLAGKVLSHLVKSHRCP